MKKEELTAIGVTEEQADKIFALNGRDIEKHKAAADAAQAKISELNEQLSQREADIAELKKVDGAGLQAKLEELQNRYAAEKQEWERKEQRRVYEDRRNEFFKGMEFADDYARRGVLSEFDEKGFRYSDADKAFVGAKEWLENLKESSPTAFKNNAGAPYVAKATVGNKSPEITKDLFAKMGYLDRLKLKKENPDTYDKLKE